MTRLETILMSSVAAAGLAAAPLHAQGTEIDAGEAAETPAEGPLIEPPGERVVPRNYDTDFGETHGFGDRPVAELVGMDVVGPEGETVGEVEDFALIGSQLVVIVGVGGLLDLAEHEVAMDLGDLSWNGEVLIGNYSEQELLALPEWDEAGGTVLSRDATLRNEYEAVGTGGVPTADAAAVTTPGDVSDEEVSVDAQAGQAGEPEDQAQAADDETAATPSADEVATEAPTEPEEMASTPAAEESGAAEEAEQTVSGATDETGTAETSLEPETSGPTTDAATDGSGHAADGVEVTEAQPEGTGQATDAGGSEDAGAQTANDGAAMGGASGGVEEAVDEVVDEVEQARGSTEETSEAVGDVTEIDPGATEADSEVGEPVMLEEGEEPVAGEAADQRVATAAESDASATAGAGIAAPADDTASDEAAAASEAGAGAAAGDETAAPQQAAEDQAGAEAAAPEWLAAIGDRTPVDLIGLDVVDSDGEVVGDVGEVGRRDGQLYAIFGVGGFLGLGQRQVAVPLERMRLDGERMVLTDIAETDLRDREAFTATDIEGLPSSEPVANAYTQ